MLCEFQSIEAVLFGKEDQRYFLSGYGERYGLPYRYSYVTFGEDTRKLRSLLPTPRATHCADSHFFYCVKPSYCRNDSGSKQWITLPRSTQVSQFRPIRLPNMDEKCRVAFCKGIEADLMCFSLRGLFTQVERKVTYEAVVVRTVRRPEECANKPRSRPAPVVGSYRDKGQSCGLNCFHYHRDPVRRVDRPQSTGFSRWWKHRRAD